MTMTKIKLNFKFGTISASNLNAIRKRNTNRLIIGQININSLRNYFESLSLRNQIR